MHPTRAGSSTPRRRRCWRSARLRGDGAMANIALGRALDSEPGYGLARLLGDALAARDAVGPARAAHQGNPTRLT